MSVVGAAVLRVGNISSPSSPSSHVGDTLKLLPMGGCGVGRLRRGPLWGAARPSLFLLARDKYIAPLNLQTTSDEVKSR